MSERIKIAVIGGSGYWSDRNHHRHILELKSKYEVELTAIVDYINPRKVVIHKNTNELCRIDNTAWLNPSDFKDVDEILVDLKNNYGVNLVIIASTPCTHYEYGIATVKQGIHTICDKPIISHKNAATSLEAASTIRDQYYKLLKKYKEAKEVNPRLLFHSILRRRSLESFTKVAHELNIVYRKSNAGLNNMTILINGGVCKLPAELSNAGAHGYLDGIGSFSHSAYHYVDAIAWFVSQAPGRACKLVPKLNYVTRVSDYLEAESYKQIAKTLNVDDATLTIPQLSDETLGCELNVGFTLTMKTKENITVGLISILFNHVSFNTRTIGYDPSVREVGDHKGGGRMSQSFIDVHQEGLQNWQIAKNDVALDDNTITLHGRRHPSIEGKEYEYSKYENAYDSNISMKDLLADTFQYISKGDSLKEHNIVRELSEERLAVEIYTACYELIAAEYQGSPFQSPDISIS